MAAKPFTVVGLKGGKVVPQSRERQPFTQINPDDVVGHGSTPADTARALRLIQDNTADATLPARTNPLLHGEIRQSVSGTSGANLVIKHGLGEPWAYYTCVRTRSGSAFAAVDAANNGGMDPKQYLVLAMHSTGVYDISIHPG